MGAQGQGRVNAFLVERRGSRRGRSLAAGLVDDGWSLLLYPEGSRTEDGWLTGATHQFSRCPALTAAGQPADGREIPHWRRVWEATRPPAGAGPRQVWAD